ncbi:class A beta-lactamase [Spirosoma sp. HMF4905]|uniref:beta-lactamase n=1 Tax=Spirosoma arboris TaxID=2682092 RepID=A0A7K1SC22_9BACT|nr:class A beta-lactamase [Spirosoma arboris]MVM31315.1 class A beta-lactamase [Spirosoma arboris]
MKLATNLLTFSVLFCTHLGIAQKPKLSKATAPAPAPAFTVPVRLEQELFRLSNLSAGKVGICAVHLESGKTITQNGKDHFPMASSYKVAIATQLLSRVDSGSITLAQLVPILKTDFHPGSGMLSERFNWPNSLNSDLSLSVRSLLELMLLISDNSATDLCLRLAGGPAAVNACMKRLGVEGLQVNRPTAWLIADCVGIPMDINQAWSPARYDSLAKFSTPATREASYVAFENDIRDTSTPEAMTLLLTKLYTQPVLKPDSKTLLLDIMKRCETGLARLKGALPPDTEVLHKTGTIGLTASDVGIITLPGDAGHVAISVFVKSSKKEGPVRERTIAEVTRTIYDYFLFQ